jgi:mycothiol synthase
VRLRPPTAADHSALVDFVAEAQRAYGTGGASEGEIRDRLAGRFGDLERRYRVAVDDDRIAGWAYLWDPTESHERLFIDLCVYPRDDRVDRALLDWGEARAAEIMEGGPGRLLVSAADDNAGLAEELGRRGFEVVRQFFRMEIDHADAPAEPVWPAGITVRTFRPDDARAVYEAADEAFADHWDHFQIRYEDWLHWGPEASNFDPTLWFLAEEKGVIAGVSLCRQARDPDAGLVAVLAVRRPWRRRGLGRALLLHSFAEFSSRGYRKTELGVDAESLTGAVRLYERAGMHVAKRFDTFEKRVGNG